MLFLIFYYLVLPFAAAALVLRFIRRFGGDPVPPEVRRNCAADPIEHKWFRVLEKRPGQAGGLRIAKVGDFDARDKAVDAAYAGRAALAARHRAASAEAGVSWLVVDERGDLLEEIA